MYIVIVNHGIVQSKPFICKAIIIICIIPLH